MKHTLTLLALFTCLVGCLEERTDEPAPDDEAAAAAQYELLALDALARERFGWASVCLSAATLRYSEADRTDDAAWATACDRRVRRECFPPFADDAERLEVVRGWARARAAELVTHAEAEADAALSGDAPEPLACRGEPRDYEPRPARVHRQHVQRRPGDGDRRTA